MKTLLSLLFVCLVCMAFAQVELDKPLQLTGTGQDARISGIKAITDPEDAASAVSIQHNSVSYAPAAGSVNAYSVDLAPAITGYAVGLTVHFKSNNQNTGPCSLNVNGQGALPIRKNFNVDLAAGDIRNGQLVSVMFDGTQFQMLSQLGSTASGGTSITVYDSEQPCKQVNQNTASWTFAEVFSAAYNAGEDLHKCFFIYGKGNHTFEFQSGASCPGSSFQISGGPCGTNMSSNLSPASTWGTEYMSTGGCVSGINAAVRPQLSSNKLVCFH
jgi:hypothetical protein